MGRIGTFRSVGGGGEDFAGGHHAFLVGEADGLAGEDGGMSGLEAGDADDGRHNEIHFRRCRAGNGALGAVDDFDSGDSGLPQHAGKLSGMLFGGQRDDLRPPAAGLRKGFLDVAPGRQGGDGVAVGKLLDDGEGALSDGAGGTENCDSFQ